MGNSESKKYEDTIDPLNIGKDYSVFTCKKYNSGEIIIIGGKDFIIGNGEDDPKTCDIIVSYYNSILNRFNEVSKTKGYNTLFIVDLYLPSPINVSCSGECVEPFGDIYLYISNSEIKDGFIYDIQDENKFENNLLTSYLSAEQAKIISKDKKVDYKNNSDILNSTFKGDNLYNILINYDVVLDNKNSKITTKNGANYQKVIWIITGETTIKNTTLKGTVISNGNIAVINSKIQGRLFSINGNVILDNKSKIYF
jgi:hypothetical protein